MKRLLLMAALALSSTAAMAQENSLTIDVLPVKNSGWEIGAGVGIQAPTARFGVNGHLKYFFNTKDIERSGFTMTLKGIHFPSTDGGNFGTIFDGTKTNNISAVLLMGGYRQYLSNPTEKGARWYADFNGGLAIVTRKSFGFGMNINLGRDFNKNWGAYLGGNAVYTNWADPDSIELGLTYRLR